MSTFAVGRKFIEFLSHSRRQAGRQATLEQQEKERDIAGKIVIVTGANRGQGKVTALELARRGAQVIMACRDLAKAEEARDEILAQIPQGKLVLFKLDLGDLASIRQFAKNIKDKYDKIDILINNAGIYQMDQPGLTRTKDGFETHMGINHLGPFLLTNLLLDLLQKVPDSRVIFVTSFLLKLAQLDLENLNMTKKKEYLGFNNVVPYANSKLAICLGVTEFARRLSHGAQSQSQSASQDELGVPKIYAACPGIVYTLNLADEPMMKRMVLRFAIKFALFDLNQGIATTLYCALSPSVANESGHFYRSLLRDDSTQTYFGKNRAEALWKKSEELVGLTSKE